MLIVMINLDGWDTYGGLRVRSRRTQDSKCVTSKTISGYEWSCVAWDSSGMAAIVSLPE